MSSRKEQKEQLKAERLERERQAAAAARRKRLVGYGVGGALALAALVAIVVVLASGGDDGGGGGGAGYPGGGSVPEQRETDLRRATAAAGCQARTFPEEGNGHVTEPVQYRTNPPTSGDHNPEPSEDDIYATAPPTEQLVHALEHGRIVIQFQPNAPDAVRADLKALYDEDPAGVILTPNETGMKTQVAATAWRNSLTCPRMNDQAVDAIRAFKDAHRGRGPEPVPF